MSAVRVLYIAGYGRSGSTVLDTVLGTLPGVVSTGELEKLAAARADDEPCACGAPVTGCAFWQAVTARLASAGLDLASFEQDRRHLEHRLGALRLLARRSARADRYAAGTRALFAAILAESGRNVIVDSSKTPARAEALARVAGLDLFVLHLVRDGRGVAWSLAKALARDAAGGVATALRPRSVVRTALSWRFTNEAARRLFAARPADRRLLVRYEDYVRALPVALAPLGEFLGLTPAELGARLVDEGGFRPGHAVAGNRLRLQQSVRLTPDVAWRSGLSPRDRARFQRLAGSTMRAFGYLDGEDA